VFFYGIDATYNLIDIICWYAVPALVSLYQRKINY